MNDGVRVKKLIGIYHADGGLIGELRYVLGKITGRSSCALCTITHGMNPFGKKAWKEKVEELPLPMDFVHLNEMDSELTAFMKAHTAPAIVLMDEKPTLLIEQQEMEYCEKSPKQLKKLILSKLKAMDDK